MRAGGGRIAAPLWIAVFPHRPGMGARKISSSMSQTYPLFVKRDLDGFFGLLIDNLVQLLLIPLLCAQACGMTGDDSRYIYRYMLPGAAVSILIGNVFYAWQAHRLAARTGRNDVTAL